MGRGLSDLQRRILAVLKKDGGLIRRKDLTPLIYGEGGKPTKSMIINLSRSIQRLATRRLVDVFGSSIIISEGGLLFMAGRRAPPLGKRTGIVTYTVETISPIQEEVTHLTCWCGYFLPGSSHSGHVLPKGWKIEYKKHKGIG